MLNSLVIDIKAKRENKNSQLNRFNDHNSLGY